MKLRWLIFVFVAIVRPAFATLLIYVHQNDAIYVGSDSQASVAVGTNSHQSLKVFPIATNCCITMSGLVASAFSDTNKGVAYTLQIGNALDSLCHELCYSRMPIQEKFANVSQRVSAYYRSYIDKMIETGIRLNADDILNTTTVISFVGFDAARKDFFFRSCELRWTNAPNLDAASPEAHWSIPESKIYFQGEWNFLATLQSDPARFQAALADDSSAHAFGVVTNAFRLLNSSETVSDDDVIDDILEMFVLHKRYAAKMGYSKGEIDQPYLIFKITRETIEKIR